MSISESPISSAPISAGPEDDVESIPLAPGIRRAIPLPPPVVVYAGWVVRWEGIDEDNFRPPTTVQLIRKERPVYPDPNVLSGHAQIIPGVSEDAQAPTKKPEWIVNIRPTYPDANVLAGRQSRQEGRAPDFTRPIVEGLRIARPVYPDPNVLSGHAQIIPGVSENFAPPTTVQRLRVIRPVYPNPNVLTGFVTRYENRTILLTLDLTSGYVQNYRVADSAFSRYELYVGVDALPDLTTEPQAIGSALPVSFPVDLPPSGSTKTLYAVLRERSEYGVISTNQQMIILVIDSAGAVELAPPGPPVNLQVFPDVTGGARVMMRYNSAADGANPADTWEVFAAEGGAPDPDIDTPADTETIKDAGGMAYYSGLITGYTPGATLYVIGSVLRASDGKRGTVGPVTLLLPLAPAIDGDKASMFGGEVFENR